MFLVGPKLAKSTLVYRYYLPHLCIVEVDGLATLIKQNPKLTVVKQAKPTEKLLSNYLNLKTEWDNEKPTRIQYQSDYNFSASEPN